MKWVDSITVYSIYNKTINNVDKNKFYFVDEFVNPIKQGVS